MPATGPMDRPITKRLTLGRLRLAIHCEDERWGPIARDRYHRYLDFAVPARADCTVVYRVTRHTCPPARDIATARARPLDVRRTADGWQVEGLGIRARSTADGSRAEIEWPLATYPLDQVLPMLWYAAGGGPVIHGALLATEVAGADDGKAAPSTGCWICAGESGAGKSTLAGLFPRRALCDELCALEGDNSGAGLRATALPYYQGHAGSAPLRCIHFLTHGRRPRRRRLSACEAFARLRTQVLWPVWDRDLLTRSFDHVAEVAERRPPWELRFRPDRDVWPVLSRAA